MKNILCFGDSNTWGYNPVNKLQFPEGIRWTSLLQSKLEKKSINILEEGLCGRTTIYEDASRPDRKGIDSLPGIFNKYDQIDSVILMLGTNDCKAYNHSSPESIALGIDRCLELITRYVPADKVILVSPIVLGEDVWKDEFDPEFDVNSVRVSKGLRNAYAKVARKRGVHFIAASDYVQPSEEDQEHMNVKGHRVLASVLNNYINDNLKGVA
ncbi:MAG: GDSL-type esterase/lipase family protein [Lachnospiraceae bacterium]|nr:GDSL-type esterase/lipase family protein [Lachnospiraceae bacterium]